MIKIIDILGFKVNRIREQLRKNSEPQTPVSVKNAMEAVPALLKEPRGSSKSRQHLRVVK
jgi:hypothetical protein